MTRIPIATLDPITGKLAVEDLPDNVLIAITDRGAWASGTQYHTHDLVTYGGTTWLVEIAHVSTSTFDDTKFTELNSYRGVWQANTRYESGDQVVNGGALYAAISTFTSGSSFNPTNWTLLTSGGGAGVISFNSRTGAVTLSKADVTATGLAAGDVAADASGAAAAAQAASDPSGSAAAAQAASLQKSSNLSDVASAPTARTNLGLGSAATHAATDFDTAGAAAAAQAASDPSGSASAAQAASLQKSSNLSDVASAPTSRTNLGLGSAATHAATDFDTAGAATAAQAAAIAASAQGLTPTAVKTAGYTAAAGDFVPVDISGGAVTVTLPSAPADKTRIGVKVVKVDGSHANAATVARGGSDVFNVAAGSTTLTLSALFQGVLLQYNATPGIWYVSTADTPIGQANGAASLGTDGKHKSSEIPSSVEIASSTEVFAPVATGVAATDDANLRAAITATPAGGTLWLDGHYLIQTSALTLASSITIKGRQKVTYSGLSALPSGPNALTQVAGAIIEQTTAAVDCLAVTMAGQAFHMQDVVVAFTSGLASTGHGINCAPASNVVGVYGGSLTRVLAFGHDGNHYGLVRTNSLEFTTIDYRWWGGGGILDVATAGTINYGNTVDIHPYGTLTKAGSAHGFAKSSAAGTTGPAGGGGSLNLMVFVRPQCNIAGAAGSGGTQKAWSDTVGAAYPWMVKVIGADFEASGFTNSIDFGPGTRLDDSNYFSTQFDSLNTAVGYKALGTAGLNAATQHKSVAVGYSALASQSTSVQNTAVGYFAGNAITTGTGLNTLVGYQAGKLITTGTTNTALGGNALAANLTGGSNTAVGKDALLVNTASSNTAIGSQTLNGVTGGSQHVAVGTGAGQTNPINANYGTFVGYTAGTSGDNSGVTAIGNSAKGNAANTTALGKGAVASAAGGVAIGIDSAGTTVTAANADTIALGTAKHVVLLAGAATASAPTYQKGAMYFDTTLNKLRIGGATAWETVTSS